MTNASGHAVEDALHINPEDPVEVLLRSVFQVSHVGNARAVHKNVKRALTNDPVEYLPDSFLIGNITGMNRHRAIALPERTRDRCASGFIQIQKVDRGALRYEDLGNTASNAAGSAGDNSHFAI
jgi:hypothetical protein